MKPTFTAKETVIKTLGKAKIDSPLNKLSDIGTDRRLLFHPYIVDNKVNIDISFEVCRHEKKIYFDPKKVKAAIVTCGGLCPGLNNVIRAIVLALHYGYGVQSIFGLKYGLQGFIPKYKHGLVELNPQVVAEIHEMGGTILGSSRGEQPIDEVVDDLERQNMNLLFVIGGDGSLNAAAKIEAEISKRKLKIAVVGIPKTIDNDISYTSHSFGFETAVDEATKSIQCAHAEADSYSSGIGLVKLMGRNSGFIAATASRAQRVVNFVLVPEVDFDLEGPNGLFHHLEKRLRLRSHAVIVVAEGAGQKFFEGEDWQTDPSGNIKFKDIGIYLKNRIVDHFKKKNFPINLKYIDPSYMIRSVPANTSDGLFCADLGQNAVHAAIAGKTRVVVSMWHGVYCLVPIDLAIQRTKTINPRGLDWIGVIESTGQPDFTNNED